MIVRQRDRAMPDPIEAPTAGIGSALRVLRKLTRKNPTMAAGLAIVLLMTLVATLAPLLFTGDPNDVDTRNRFISPSLSHWFGSDNLGRDVYTRTIYGCRVSMVVGFSVALISVFLAVVIGLPAGYYRSFDAVIMRVMDGLMSIPSVLLGMALMAMLGGSVQNVVIALIVVEAPWAVRVVRASVLGLREQMFVDAALAVGASPYRMLRYHILPNTVAPLIIQATFVGSAAVLVEATLSFLGAGPPQDVPSWGNIMAEGRDFISRAVWIIMFPGLFLTFTVLGVNLAGDGLRDILDPKLRRTV